MSDMRDKIAMLLRLAGNNPNVHEAQSALEKARALMMEHHLTERDLPGADTARAHAVKDLLDSRVGTSYPNWMGSLALTLAQAFRCEVVLHSSDRRIGLFVLGVPEDVEVVKQIYPWVRGAAINLGVAWATRTHESADSYYYGFAEGIADAFKAQEDAHQEWGLVLRRDPSVDALAKQEGVHYATTRVRGSQSSRDAGYKDGYAVGQRRTVTS